MRKTAFILAGVLLTAWSIITPGTARSDRADPRRSSDVPGGSRSSIPTSAPATAPSTRSSRESDERLSPTRSQAQQAAEILERQQQIARALKEAALREAGRGPPPGDLRQPSTSTPSIDTLQSRLDVETTRHEARLAELRQEEKAARDAGDRKERDRVKKAIDRENDAYTDTVADIKKQIAELKKPPRPAKSH